MMELLKGAIALFFGGPVLVCRSILYSFHFCYFVLLLLRVFGVFIRSFDATTRVAIRPKTKGGRIGVKPISPPFFILVKKDLTALKRENKFKVYKLA
jgi:hypothetical protein